MSQNSLPEFIRPSNRSFRLRGTRITAAQQTATDRFWDQYGITPDHQMIMEIGTGMGEATAEIARTFPEIGFLAVEVHRPGIGALLARINDFELSNIRLISEDARVLLAELMADESLDAIHLYFPDPWPKSKHWKRRIVQQDFIELIAKKLKPKGYIHIATDWLGYASWVQEQFSNTDLFDGGVIPKPAFRPETRFEEKGLTKGHLVTDLKYIKRS